LFLTAGVGNEKLQSVFVLLGTEPPRRRVFSLIRLTRKCQSVVMCMRKQSG
jgi:hypothetical protein